MTTFAQSKIHCTGISGKLKISMELKTSVNNSNKLAVVASLTGKLEMTGQVQMTDRLGVYEGPLTEYGDPLEIVLVFPNEYEMQNKFHVLLKLEDGEEIYDFDLSCIN